MSETGGGGEYAPEPFIDRGWIPSTLADKPGGYLKPGALQAAMDSLWAKPACKADCCAPPAHDPADPECVCDACLGLRPLPDPVRVPEVGGQMSYCDCPDGECYHGEPLATEAYTGICSGCGGYEECYCNEE
jgi:hypothetical protein